MTTGHVLGHKHKRTPMRIRYSIVIIRQLCICRLKVLLNDSNDYCTSYKSHCCSRTKTTHILTDVLKDMTKKWQSSITDVSHYGNYLDTSIHTLVFFGAFITVSYFPLLWKEHCMSNRMLPSTGTMSLTKGPFRLTPSMRKTVDVFSCILASVIRDDEKQPS